MPNGDSVKEADDAKAADVDAGGKDDAPPPPVKEASTKLTEAPAETEAAEPKAVAAGGEE